MIGSYVLSFQVYLALPLHAAVLAPQHASALIAAMFVVSGVVAVTAQLRITRWFSHRWGSSRSLVIGMTVVALSFVPLILLPDNRFGSVAAIGALLACAAVLAIGSAAVFPFEMDTVVALSGGRLVGTHYGFYSTIVGVGILVGNVATGALMQAARDRGRGCTGVGRARRNRPALRRRAARLGPQRTPPAGRPAPGGGRRPMTETLPPQRLYLK